MDLFQLLGKWRAWPHGGRGNETAVLEEGEAEGAGCVGVKIGRSDLHTKEIVFREMTLILKIRASLAFPLLLVMAPHLFILILAVMKS